jgi:hypothetical protein
VGAHGARADPEVVRDLLVAPRGGNQGQDLGFAAGEPLAMLVQRDEEELLVLDAGQQGRRVGSCEGGVGAGGIRSTRRATPSWMSRWVIDW